MNGVRDLAMSRTVVGKTPVTFVLLAGALIAVGVDWNKTHLFNPAWHPHARLHGVMYLLILCGVSAVAIWLLWRRSPEPGLGMKVASLISLTIWTLLLYAI
jgi:hypothetical protein